MIAALGVFCAAALAFGLGALWYGLLFPKTWLAATGRTTEDLADDGSPAPFFLAALGALTASAAMRAGFERAGLDTPIEGLAAGAVLGLLVLFPWIALHYAFAGRPRMLWWIDGGHAAAAMLVIGFTLGAFL